MIKLYGSRISGNCWKPASLMQQLEIPYEWIEVDLLAGETRTEEYLARNPNGKLPLLEVRRGLYLAESNAMLCYLAEGSPLLPEDRWARAKVMEWLFFEQYTHETAIATVRFWVRFLGKGEEWREKIAETMVKGHAALAVMEKRLNHGPFMAGDAYTIADIALFAYTHVADEGGYDLSHYPAIRMWLDRVAEQPRFEPMRRA